MRWNRVGLDESATRSSRSDDERAKSILRSGSAGAEHPQELHGPIVRERTCSPEWLMIGWVGRANYGGPYGR